MKYDKRGLLKIIGSVSKEVDAAVRETAFSVEAKAAIAAPKDTWALTNSIETEKIEDGLYHVQDGVEYGIYQELGTSKMAAQPFLVPSVESERINHNQRLGKAVEESAK